MQALVLQKSLVARGGYKAIKIKHFLTQRTRQLLAFAKRIDRLRALYEERRVRLGIPPLVGRVGAGAASDTA